MKKIIILVLLNAVFACHSQKINNMNLVNSNTEKYHEILFNKITQQNDVVKRGFLENNNYFEIYFNSKNIKITLETPQNIYFSIYKEYFNNNLKLKGLRFNNNNDRSPLKKGIWYEFDESGKLIKETNYDEPYKFNFEDILIFCDKEKIKIDKGPILQSTGYHTHIRRGIENGKSWWEIEWMKKSDTIETIKLDGITGKVLSRTTAGYTNN